jgi:acyl-CoA reductase-like NAD-dependent aldehyde dehydrogenase
MNLFTALKEAGIPDGVANLVNGDSAKIGEAMLENPKLKKISFTGSTRVGKILMDGASKTNTKLALELGGNAPVIIMDDVDVEQVAKTAVSSKFRNAGQVCVAPQRFFVHRKIYDAFVTAAAHYAKAHVTGNGLETAFEEWAL